MAREGEDMSREQRLSLREFVREADYFMDLLKGMLACAARSDDETLTYLHTCVSDRWHRPGRWPLSGYRRATLRHPARRRVVSPARRLACAHLFGHGLSRSIHGRHGAALDAADLDFRWCTRWLGLEKHVQAGVLRKTQGAWVGQEKSFIGRITENLSHQPPRVLNTDATNKAEDVDAARQEVGADIVAYGEFSSTVTVWDPDPDAGRDEAPPGHAGLCRSGLIATAERQHARPRGSPVIRATASIMCAARPSIRSRWRMWPLG